MSDFDARIPRCPPAIEELTAIMTEVERGDETAAACATMAFLQGLDVALTHPEYAAALCRIYLDTYGHSGFEENLPRRLPLEVQS